ncbi:MAG: hypothetical protein OEZ47_12975 [Gammaproteobacteria bacterium]|nr:hypothetical protein [Gammaproteobacteria bacterium]
MGNSISALRWSVVALLAAMFLAACGSGGDSSDSGTNPKDNVLFGTVKSFDGRRLAGVQVFSQDGKKLGETNEVGDFRFSTQSNLPTTLKLHSEGYVDGIVSINNALSNGFNATLRKRNLPLELDINNNVDVQGQHGAGVALEANSLVDEDGVAVSGKVQLSITPVNVSDPEELKTFPGGFSGTNLDGSNAPVIVSYGTVEFRFSQNGKKLNLAPGKKATIEIPSFVTKNPDGSAIQVGDEGAIWSLDENTGEWLHETTGKVVASGDSPTGLAIRAEVSHFSYWNYDLAPELCRMNISVDSELKVKGSNVVSSFFRISSYTIEVPHYSAHAVALDGPLWNGIWGSGAAYIQSFYRHSTFDSLAIESGKFIDPTGSVILPKSNTELSVAYSALSGSWYSYDTPAGQRSKVTQAQNIDGREFVVCNQDQVDVVLNLIETNQLPEIKRFSAKLEPVFGANNVILGNELVVDWDVEGAGNISVEYFSVNDTGGLLLPLPDDKGREIISVAKPGPNDSRFFNVILHAENGDEHVQQQVQVEYLEEAPPKLLAFEVLPVPAETSRFIRWQVEGADRVTVSLETTDGQTDVANLLNLTDLILLKDTGFKLDANAVLGAGYPQSPPYLVRVVFMNEHGIEVQSFQWDPNQLTDIEEPPAGGGPT